MKWMLKQNCILHPLTGASVRIDGVDLCYECWNRASAETREKIKRAVANWNKGLYTKEDFENVLAMIATDPNNPELMASIEKSDDAESYRRTHRDD